MFKYFKIVFKNPDVLNDDSDLLDAFTNRYSSKEFIPTGDVVLDMFKSSIYYKTRHIWLPFTNIARKIDSVIFAIQRWILTHTRGVDYYTTSGILGEKMSSQIDGAEENLTATKELISSITKK